MFLWDLSNPRIRSLPELVAICEQKPQPKSKLSLLPMSPKGACEGGCPPHALNISSPTGSLRGLSAPQN